MRPMHGLLETLAIRVLGKQAQLHFLPISPLASSALESIKLYQTPEAHLLLRLQDHWLEHEHQLSRCAHYWDR
jgi:hypothetical protein